jgi:hypothetical protein
MFLNKKEDFFNFYLFFFVGLQKKCIFATVILKTIFLPYRG